jgi:glycine cleavage system aminomethyltransferase T
MTDDDWIALGEAARRVIAKQRPTFILRVEYAGTAGFEIHALRKLLKSLIRAHKFRCLEIREGGK